MENEIKILMLIPIWYCFFLLIVFFFSYYIGKIYKNKEVLMSSRDNIHVNRLNSSPKKIKEALKRFEKISKNRVKWKDTFYKKEK